MADYHRPLLEPLVRRLREPRRFIQVLAGPRQVGKTTLARQGAEASGLPHVFASADGAQLEDRPWIELQWQRAREAGRQSRGALLVLDEIQKIRGWSEIVKRMWDEDTASRAKVRVLLLGSSPLLVEQGLSESLTGRFEVLRATHWSLGEMRDAFRTSIDRYLWYGGYPGAVSLIKDPQRWQRYIHDSIVETTISRDILLLTRVDKPALLRRLFELGCRYSGQILSYQKMLGQLQDAGNTVTLAHYLELLGGAGMVTGLEKFSGEMVRQRASSPKLLVLNTALLAVMSQRTLDEARADGELWGRVVESAVGAHLLNSTAGTDVEVLYWTERNRDVDFVLRRGRKLAAIEVKSGRQRTSLPGLRLFQERFRPDRTLLVGTGGTPIEEFLATPASHWVR